MSDEVVDEVEAGNCAGCQLTFHNLSDESAMARKYGVRVVPTVVIDGEVKIEGRPDIPLVGSEETYAYFRQRCPFIM